MDITPETVKTWLSEHPARDRNWLAEKCETEKRTVDNWLSSPRGLPSKAVIIIENLMRADIEKQTAVAPPLYHIVLRVELEEFENWSRAALAKGRILTDWAIETIRDAYQTDMAAPANGTSQALPDSPQQRDTHAM